MRKMIAASLAVLALGACQGYEFEQVTPKAIGTVKQGEPISGQQKPAKILLALDKSGSMKSQDSNDSVWGCANDNSGNGYNPALPCKWNTLKGLIIDSGGFLDSTKASARHGLAIFPHPDTSADACRSGLVDVPVAGTPGASADAIKAKLATYAPGGGTPSADMLRTIANEATMGEEPSTKRYVVLVTDGLPNCNATIAACGACTNAGGDPSTFCGDKRNCLDDQNLVTAVKQLKAKNIDTFVIGFGGAFVSDVAKNTLNAAALAGGQPASGTTTFYQAGSADDLKAILKHVEQVIQQCNFSLDSAPQKADLLEVTVSDKNAAGADTVLVRGTDWDYNDPVAMNTVKVVGTWCTTLQNAEPDRYTVNFISVKEL